MPLTGMILAGAVASLALPSTARGGCSAHYLSWTSDPRQIAELLDVATIDQVGLPFDALPRGPAAPPPCSGPSCSGNPAPPATPGVVRSIAPIERWGVPPSLPSPDPADAALLAGPEPLARPTRGTCPLFRPPRPASGV